MPYDKEGNWIDPPEKKGLDWWIDFLQSCGAGVGLVALVTFNAIWWVFIGQWKTRR
ncbi:MAG: hypothetical protein GY841_02795 [FCB group bacterium]|nr:hypothetical protein [FCB group bacterium]